jgi:hypothetical protein
MVNCPVVSRQSGGAKLTCRGCERVTTIGLEKLLEMSATNDSFTWWRERFKCRMCGAKNSYLAIVPTHLTPMKYGISPWRNAEVAAQTEADRRN